MKWVEGFFLVYFVLLNAGYLILNLLSLFSLRQYMESHSLERLQQTYVGFDLPISLLVPAYNEEASIAASVRSLLQLDYPEFEVIVINDGSQDKTLDVLKESFGLLPFPEVDWRQIPCKEIHGIYRSRIYPQLRVIDKANGGKADALNAGINASRYPLFCGMDADSILQRDSLLRVVQPFLEDPRTIAAGGTVRIANGCQIVGGLLESIRLPSKLLARFQIVEYLRAFLFGRLGWSPMNAVLIVSGAFGLFKKSAVIEAGGYNPATVGEDMELIVRLHRLNRMKGTDYRIIYVPDPICWTEAPESLRVLRSQRTRWQRGLAESLSMNKSLLFHRKSGLVGWFAFPFFVLFELLGPVVEVVGYLVMTLGFLLGAVSVEAFQAFMFVAVSLGILLSVTALLMEELSFSLFPRKRDVVILFVTAVLENFGYRQLIAVWRLQGLLKWLTGTQQSWGDMTRTGSLESTTNDQSTQKN